MQSISLGAKALSPRERILIAAHDLFYREGIRATGIDRIIKASKVTKVTFYRQFTSKDELIKAYLAYRNVLWMAWFQATLTSAMICLNSPSKALISTLNDWFARADFRGCAFLNAAAELGATDSRVLEIVREHKNDLALVLEGQFSAEGDDAGRGHALVLAMDGAILQAQMGQPLDHVLASCEKLIAAVLPR